MAELPLCPSDVAVIVAAPPATPLTSPLPLTVATPGLLLAQVTVRPLSGFPFASLGVTVRCTVWPAGTDADAGLTVTDATGTVAPLSAAVPALPSLAGGARVDGTARRAPRHGDIGAVTRGREADGEEVLSLVLLQRDVLRGNNELCDDGAEISDGVLATDDDRGDGQGRHDRDRIFEPRQSSGQLVRERHEFLPYDCSVAQFAVTA